APTFDRSATRGRPVRACAVMVGSLIRRPISRAWRMKRGRAPVVARPEDQQAGLEVRLSAMGVFAAGRPQNPIEACRAVLEALGRHPEGSERSGETNRLVPASLVDEPLDRRQQVAVALLELSQQDLGVQPL